MFNPHPISQKSAWLASILVLFVLASGIVGYQLRIQSQTEVAPTVVDTPLTITEPVVEQVPTVVETPVIEDIQAHEPEPEPVPMPETQTPTTVDVADFLEEPVPVIYPLQGEIISVFSVDNLTYNETLGDWRIHDGIDIAAEAGTTVAAASDGIVLQAQADDLMGTQVVIDHGNGYQTTYANLQTDLLVAEGDSVHTGQAIGAVGTTALADADLSPHLHFSVCYQGDAMDPLLYLRTEDPA